MDSNSVGSYLESYQSEHDLKLSSVKVYVTYQDVSYHDLVVSKLQGIGICSISFDKLVINYDDDISLNDKIGNVAFSLYGFVLLNRISAVLISNEYLNEKVRTLFIRYRFSISKDSELNFILQTVTSRVQYNINLDIIEPIFRSIDSQVGIALRKSLSYLTHYDVNIGAEAESINSMYFIKNHYTTYNHPYDYDSVEELFKSTPYNSDLDKKGVYYVMNGQSKLYNVDSPMFQHCNSLCYIGGSPGSHILDYSVLPTKVSIIDPLNIDIRLKLIKNINHIADFARYKYIKYVDTLIIDIRRDPICGKSNVCWDMQIDYENAFTSLIYWNYWMLNKTIKFVVKFHPGLCSRVLVNGKIVYQPYANTKSRETRIYGPFNVNDYNRDDYLRKIRIWNNVVRVNFNIMREQSQRLTHIYSIHHKFTIDNLYPTVNYVSTFAISNVVNNRQLIPMILKSSNHSTFVIPRSNKKLRGEIVYNIYNESNKKSFISNGIALDHVYSPYEFTKLGYYVYNLIDIISYASSYIYLGNIDMQSETLFAWFIVTNKPIIPDPQVDSVFNGQTHILRLCSPLIRQMLGYDRYTLHQMRGIYLPFVKPSIGYITGYLFGEKFEAAGHLMYMLLASPTQIICFKRYMKVIHANITKDKTADFYLKANLIAERNTHYYKQWHTKSELFSGVYLAIKFARLWGIHLDSGLIKYVTDSIESLPNT